LGKISDESAVIILKKSAAAQGNFKKDRQVTKTLRLKTELFSKGNQLFRGDTIMKHSIWIRRFFMSFLLLAFTAGCATTSTQENTSQYLHDSAITSAVKQKIAGDPDLRNFEISVETHEGVVQLSGFVNSTNASLKAEKLAGSVKNVSRVNNRLIVKGSG
jgi:hypothetical protein